MSIQQRKGVKGSYCTEVLNFYMHKNKWTQTCRRITNEWTLETVSKSPLIRSCFPLYAALHDANDPSRQSLRDLLDNEKTKYEAVKRVFGVCQAFLQHIGIVCLNMKTGAYVYTGELESPNERHQFLSEYLVVGQPPLYAVFLYKVFDCMYSLGYEKGCVGLYNLIRDMTLRGQIHTSQMEYYKNHFIKPALDLMTQTKSWNCRFFPSIVYPEASGQREDTVMQSLVIPHSLVNTNGPFEVVPLCHHSLLCSQTMVTVQMPPLAANQSNTSKVITQWKCPFFNYNAEKKCNFEIDCHPQKTAEYFSWP